MMRTGRLLRPADSYPYLTVLALLQEGETAKDELSVAARSTRSQRGPDSLWSEEPEVVTGDPLVDKWEREIAAGIEPDLDEGLE